MWWVRRLRTLGFEDVRLGLEGLRLRFEGLRQEFEGLRIRFEGVRLGFECTRGSYAVRARYLKAKIAKRATSQCLLSQRFLSRGERGACGLPVYCIHPIYLIHFIHFSCVDHSTFWFIYDSIYGSMQNCHLIHFIYCDYVVYFIHFIQFNHYYPFRTTRTLHSMQFHHLSIDIVVNII